MLFATIAFLAGLLIGIEIAVSRPAIDHTIIEVRPADAAHVERMRTTFQEALELRRN